MNLSRFRYDPSWTICGGSSSYFLEKDDLEPHQPYYRSKKKCKFRGSHAQTDLRSKQDHPLATCLAKKTQLNLLKNKKHPRKFIQMLFIQTFNEIFFKLTKHRRGAFMSASGIISTCRPRKTPSPYKPGSSQRTLFWRSQDSKKKLDS